MLIGNAVSFIAHFLAGVTQDDLAVILPRHRGDIGSRQNLQLALDFGRNGFGQFA